MLEEKAGGGEAAEQGLCHRRGERSDLSGKTPTFKPLTRGLSMASTLAVQATLPVAIPCVFKGASHQRCAHCANGFQGEGDHMRMSVFLISRGKAGVLGRMAEGASSPGDCGFDRHSCGRLRCTLVLLGLFQQGLQCRQPRLGQNLSSPRSLLCRLPGRDCNTGRSAPPRGSGANPGVRPKTLHF